MTITLFKNLSDPRCIVKNMQQVGEQNIPLEFIENSDVVNPVLKMTPESNVLQANYAYIPEWGRYYFIENHTVSKGYIYVNMKSDVLQSFASQIRECKAVVTRNQKRYNLYQVDDQFKIENRRALQRVEFDKGFDSSSQEFLLCVIGNTQGGE